MNTKTNGRVLLSREQFREGVFLRDNHQCVCCGAPSADAHHIIERRLWSDGGYYLDNGASVCGDCHIKCEQTLISCDDLREKIGITKPILPEYFYDDVEYDKWGNTILPNGMRTRGDLYDDESVRKILEPVAHLFTPYVKYGRTYHLPWSPGINSDDKMMRDTSAFEGNRVIVMEKMDGENTTMYPDHIHARSLTSASHPSQSWVKALHGRVCGDIPEGWRVNVENVYAKHSIHYTDLTTYAYVFSIWNDKNIRLTWDEMLTWCELFGMHPVPMIYHGTFDKAAIDRAYAEYTKKLQRECEGYVIVVDQPFHFSQFKKYVGKYVRKDHVQTVQHWRYGQPIVPNVLLPGLNGFEQWSNHK